MNGDLYTSEEQKQRDIFEINDSDWQEVTIEQVSGSSICKLALHDDWVQKKGYQVNAVVNMNLPEQGISGPFKITSIKHIIPQKKPVDEDESDEWEYRPVTGLFLHQSDDLLKIRFDNREELGVTNNHPIFSVSKGDWQHAGQLEIGEKVLTLNGDATVVSKDTDPVSQPVYNLEVKDLHNFLVGNEGVVVHNGCLNELLEFFGKWKKKKHSQWLDFAEESGLPNADEIKQFQDLGEKINKRFFGLGKSTRTNRGFPGIDGFNERGRPISLKIAQSESTGGDLMTTMVEKANNLNDGIVEGHQDMAGLFPKIDGMLTAKLSTKQWLKQRWLDRLNNSNLKTDIIEDLFVEAKDGWMVWKEKQDNGEICKFN